MRIVVFGANGLTGSAVVERALTRDHEVTAFVRSEPLGRASRVVRGDARDAEAVGAALRGQDAAVSALGVPIVGPTRALSRPTATVIAAAGSEGVHQVSVVLSVVVFLSSVSERFVENRREHLRNLEALRASPLRWVGLCPAAIEDRPGSGSYEVVLDGRAPGRSISRVDLADALLDGLSTEAWWGHAAGVSGPDARP